MEELIVVGNAKLERYKELLLKKDSLTKEAFQYQIAYIKEFGDLITECFEAKIACIEKKKIIAYCQKLINKGLKPNQVDIDRMIEETMKDYYEKLKDMLADNNKLKKESVVSEYVLRKIKSIYYRIAKLIHPDMNPSLKDDEKAKELWNRTAMAYECNCLKDIEELEVLVNEYLESIDYKSGDFDIPDIEEKIYKLNEEITNIRETDPYQYKYLLNDVDAVQEKKDSIKSEKQDYIDYAKELDEIIKTFDIERMMA